MFDGRISHHNALLNDCVTTIPGRSQCLFKELLDFDEVCFEGAVVEEERRVSPRGQVFELSWLPGDDVKRWTGRRVRKG